jgi:hypothetical protein
VRRAYIFIFFLWFLFFLWHKKKKPHGLEIGGKFKHPQIHVIASMSKGIRFGLVFAGPRPSTDGSFLPGLSIKHIEGCDVGEKHYVMFSLEKAKRPTDLLHAVQEYNQTCADLDEELLMASDGMLSSPSSAIVLLPFSATSTVVKPGTKRLTGKSSALSKIAVFERGFQSHDIFRIICTAKLTQFEVQAPPVPDGQASAPAQEEDVVSNERPTGYWTWGCAEAEAPPSPLSAPASMKRAINELESDLVEDRIKPSAPKRLSGVVPTKDSELASQDDTAVNATLLETSDDNSILDDHAKDELLDAEQVGLFFWLCIDSFLRSNSAR